MGVCCTNNQAGFTSRLLGPVCRRRIAPERRGRPACGSAPSCQCFSRPSLTRICLRWSKARLSISLYSVRVGECGCEDIPTWTISCYTQHTTQSVSEPSRKPVAPGTERDRQMAREDVPVAAAASCHSLKRRRRTCWGADDSGQEEQGALCYRIQLMVAVGS